MHKLHKRIISAVTVAAMILNIVPYNTNIVNVDNVKAATNPLEYESGYLVDDKIIPDTVLLKAIKYIVGGSESANITFKQLKDYTGNIDLSSYTDIKDVTGLGYALNAVSIDISRLTKVTVIYADEFKDCSFTTFNIAPNITEIRSGAFSGCDNLETISLPQGLIKIHDKAFRDCVSLDNIDLPDGIQYIGGEAFANCTSLKNIVIPDGINAATESSDSLELIGIGANVFNGCSSLQSITIGAGMTAIPTGFLIGTVALTAIDIPEKIVSIRNAAFSGSGIRAIDISRNTGISVISKETFSNCNMLADVKLPDTITEIQEAAFFGCSSIRNTQFLTELANLVTIGKEAFSYIGAQSVTIPANVETIGMRAFAKSYVKNLTITDFDMSKVVSAKIKKIGEAAFQECKFLENVYFPTENETSGKVSIEIGKYAFSKCYTLKEINLPLNVTLVNDYAFEYCGSSTTDWANNKVGRYKGRRYYTTANNISPTQTGNLTQVVLYTLDIEKYCQPTVVYVDMSKCSLTKSDDMPVAVIIADNVSGQIAMHIQIMTGIETLNLTQNTNTIFGKGVFQNCINLKEVSLPNNMKEIPEKMFYNCFTNKKSGNGSNVSSNFKDWYYGLKTVHISDNTQVIGKSAFEKCKVLELNETLPSQLTQIKDSAFRECERIGALALPNSLTYIGARAFQSCSRKLNNYLLKDYGLTECNAKGASKIAYIGANAFAACPFTEFSMNAQAPVTHIGASAFNECTNMTRIEFSDYVGYIGSSALGLCYSLKSVTIPDICILDPNIVSGVKNVGGAYIFTAYELNSLTLSVNNAANRKISVRENETSLLPLYLLEKNSKAIYDEINVGGYLYTWNEDLAAFDGDETNSYIIPELVSTTVNVGATDYMNETKKNIKGISLNGIKEATDVSIIVSGVLDLPVSNEIKISGITEVEYKADVTKNPCTDIIVKDAYYMSYKTNSSIVITPEFISEFDDSDITDNIVWSLDNGSDIVTLTPASDGKSATIRSLGTNCGSARVTVTAGAASKSFYVYAQTPASAVRFSVNPAKVDLMLGESTEVSAALTYNYYDEEYAATNPDKITYASSNESVVKVQNVVELDGTTKCTLVALGIGTAVITVKAEAGNKKIECIVNVTSENIKTTMTDADGNAISEGSEIRIVGKTRVVYEYAFNEKLNLNGLSYTVSNPDIVKVTVDSARGKVSFEGMKTGETDIILYPSVANSSNGIRVKLVVNADVSSINLAKKTVELGKTDSIISKLRNTFNQEWTPEAEIPFSSITDNSIVFTSSDPSIVSVDANGNVTVLRIPSSIAPVTITCNAMRGNVIIKSASTTVTPAYPSVSDVTVAANTIISVGQVIEIPLIMIPSNGAYTDVIITLNGNRDILKYEWNKQTLKLKITGMNAGSVTFTIIIKNKVEVCKKNISVTVKSKVNLKNEKLSGAKPGKVKISRAKPGKKKVTLKWNKVKGATGYQVQMSSKKKKGFKNIKKETTKQKFVKKKLKSKKTYYFRVRAYVKSDSGKKVYGKWSKVKKSKVK